MSELPVAGCTAPDPEPVLTTLWRCLLAVTPDVLASGLDGDRTLGELGCDSVDRAEVLVMVMSELGVAVPVTELGRDLTLRGIVDLLVRPR
jgi:polyketide biosynthesis acyl carrier protein